VGVGVLGVRRRGVSALEATVDADEKATTAFLPFRLDDGRRVGAVTDEDGLAGFAVERTGVVVVVSATDVDGLHLFCVRWG
jgi:hypothetical protein